MSVGGKLTSNGAITANGGSNTGNGGKINISQKGEVSAGDVSLYDYAEIFLRGKLHANNFLIQTKSNFSDLGGTGELWLEGNFTQKKNGALWWQSGKDNFCPQQGFSLILETSNATHNINFESPDQSYLYNLYRIKENSDYSDNKWTGNPSIRGKQCGVYKNGLGYSIIKNDNFDAISVVSKFKKEFETSVKKSVNSVKMGYGITEFGDWNSATNTALKEYLYSYIAGMEAIYPSSVNIGVHTWTEKISVFSDNDGKYRNVKFKFEIVDVNGQRTANVKYSYGKTNDKQCFMFMIANGSELADVIKKYATDTYSSAIADYFKLPLNQYVKDKNSKIASLIWEGCGQLQVVKIDGVQKYVKDYIKKGVNVYLDNIEKSFAGYGTSINLLSDNNVQIFDEITDNAILGNNTTLMSDRVSEPFSDEYLIATIKEELELEETDELTQEKLETIEDLNLSASYITDISGLEQCANIKHLDLSGNAISDISALSGLTNLETIDLSGNSVSDLMPLSNLNKLQSITLKSNLVSDLTGLERLTAISNLDLSFNEITDVSNIAQLTNLEVLNLIDNNITNINGLRGLTNLQTLYLGNNDISDISALSNIPVIKLDVSNNDISDIDNLNMSKVKVLNISSNNISDISALRNSNTLEELNIADNSIADISPLTNNTSINTLNINKNVISDISIVSNLINLKEFECADNYITDFSALSNLTELISLNISYNDVDDLSFIENLTSLQKLGIAGCDLYSMDMEYIPKSLVRLDVSSNSITDVSAFVALNDLSELNISNNYISDILGFAETNHDISIDLSGNGIDDEDINTLYGTMNDSPYYIDITNRMPDIALEEIYFINEDVEIIEGNEFSQDVSAMPYNANIGELVWESSDTDVVDVNNGVIIGKNMGWATITASTQDGKLYASYNVTVIKNMIQNVNISDNTVFATLENVSDIDYKSVTVIIAIYNNDVLQDTKTITVEDFAVGYYDNIQTEFDEISDGSYAKVFLWNGLESMQPIANAAKSNVK